TRSELRSHTRERRLGRAPGCYLTRRGTCQRNKCGEKDLVCCDTGPQFRTKEIAMKVLLSVAAVLLVPACGYAQGGKACEELKEGAEPDEPTAGYVQST